MKILIGIALLSMIVIDTTGQTTYCNPIDIDYKYNFEQLNDSISYRSAADPVIINHKNEYFFFL